ncbi:EscU/YscU/HrcU family type III secretion system export apparatus switch protein [Sediminicurvatus halobius]|uniref:Flagellar biosynthetic protein FlhB n=1 Tax=Sediminicurvatus halobius TaxID=2182432 RepID=A0A2U2N3M1_9GAMM|nr:EscU/YscU/HrcU family type III secretion system export apparatus switch protein [Spiribacter halobius]PWG63672.1 flagellar protein FhlB [Spiribacter halobius]UEX79811.1 EscU/YscU/HrcU family type III secretion system export apparatus switch protein [Spiribacter halobius]
MSGPKRERRQERIAVALEYTGEAPRVTAQGRGALAEEILRLAEAHDIPLQNDRDLVEVLAKLPLNQEIPAPLYRAVAEVIAFAYLVKGRRPGSGGAPDRGGD